MREAAQVVTSAETNYRERKIARSLAKLLPQARTTPIGGAAHMMLNTHPESVAGLIETSLCTHRANDPDGAERLGRAAFYRLAEGVANNRHRSTLNLFFIFRRQ